MQKGSFEASLMHHVANYSTGEWILEIVVVSVHQSSPIH